MGKKIIKWFLKYFCLILISSKGFSLHIWYEGQQISSIEEYRNLLENQIKQDPRCKNYLNNVEEISKCTVIGGGPLIGPNRGVWGAHFSGTDNQVWRFNN